MVAKLSKLGKKIGGLLEKPELEETDLFILRHYIDVRLMSYFFKGK